MLIFNEMPTAFPWYDDIRKQARYNENSNGVCDYKLISPSTSLLPFQFRRPTTKKRPIKWEIINSESFIVFTATSQLSKIEYRTLGSWDYFYYDGSFLSGMNLNKGGYYYSRIIFSDGSEFYSEMFFIPEPSFNINATNTGFLIFEWYSFKDFEPFYYTDLRGGLPYFRNLLYLDSFVHASEPEIIEEGTQDGYGELVPTFQKLSISYRVSAIVPDFLKVAIVAMQLHEVINFTDKEGIRKGQIDKISTNTSLEAGGFLSVVDILFKQELIIIKKGCTSPIGIDTFQTGWI